MRAYCSVLEAIYANKSLSNKAVSVTVMQHEAVQHIEDRI